MPYEWTPPLHEAPAPDAPGHADGAPPIAELHLWPYRSLPKRGFAYLIGMAYALLLIPVSAFIGTVAIWWLLIPGLVTIAGLWWFIEKSFRDAEILEELEIWPDHVRLTRHGPHKAYAQWEANPYWVTVEMHPTGGPVVDYLTLKGGPRDVEIGAFLHESERPRLRDEIDRALALAKSRRPDDS